MNHLARALLIKRKSDINIRTAPIARTRTIEIPTKKEKSLERMLQVGLAGIATILFSLILLILK